MYDRFPTIRLITMQNLERPVKIEEREEWRMIFGEAAQ